MRPLSQDPGYINDTASRRNKSECESLRWYGRRVPRETATTSCPSFTSLGTSHVPICPVAPMITVRNRERPSVSSIAIGNTQETRHLVGFPIESLLDINVKLAENRYVQYR